MWNWNKSKFVTELEENHMVCRDGERLKEEKLEEIWYLNIVLINTAFH